VVVGVEGMPGRLDVEQDMDKGVVVACNTAMDRFSYSDEHIQERTGWVVQAIRGSLVDQAGPCNQVYQVGQVDPNIQVHQDIRVVLANPVDLHNSLECRQVHRFVDMGQNTWELEELWVKVYSNLEYTLENMKMDILHHNNFAFLLKTLKRLLIKIVYYMNYLTKISMQAVIFFRR
jgi:hypothetical protein